MTIRKCPVCKTAGIHKKPVRELVVVKEYPTLHGFADRMDETAVVICWNCRKDGRSTGYVTD